MNIKMHRASGQHNAMIEISSSQTKIILDGGVNLEENALLLLPQLQVEYDFSCVNAVFLSHYHTDHITMVRGLLSNVPVYASKLASSIGAAAEQYRAKQLFDFAGFYVNGTSINVGNIKVTPYLVDDVVHEGYVLLIEGEGKSVLYTGDFRANGRKSFEEMLRGLPTRVDVLICEDGVIGEDDINLVTEGDIEAKASELIACKKGPVFVLQSLTDFDRATTLFHAAKRNKRVFLEDLYMSQLAGAAGNAMPSPLSVVGVKAYLTKGYKAEHFRYKMYTELPRIGKAEIETQKFVMCIRTSMKKYVKMLSRIIKFKDGIIINSLHDESFKSAETLEFLDFAAKKGLEVVTLRNSGHANAKALRALIEAVKPEKIFPLNTENVKWFRNEYPLIAIVSADTLDC